MQTRHSPQQVSHNHSATDHFVSLLKERPFVVGGLWAGVFAALIIFSYSTGIMPAIDWEEAASAPAAAVAATGTMPAAAASMQAREETPVRIIIDAIDVDAPIMNPTSRDIETLDAALQQGVVHYPGSGNLDDVSNMFLLGHSSGLRVINNQAYKIFNGLKNLKENDVIRVQSDGAEHLYRVKKVALVNASETSIPLTSDVKMLTLATCNVFGAKEERYVVTAEFVGSYPVRDGELDL